MSDVQLQRESRARIRAERKGDPNWVDLGDGWFALHIQYGGNAVTVHFDGSEDALAFREWLAFHWPDLPAA
jgi:hypothetical protein